VAELYIFAGCGPVLIHANDFIPHLTSQVIAAMNTFYKLLLFHTDFISDICYYYLAGLVIRATDKKAGIDNMALGFQKIKKNFNVFIISDA